MTILIEELKRILGEAPVKVKHHFDPAYDDWVGGEMVLEEGYVEVVERLTALRNALPAIIAQLEAAEGMEAALICYEAERLMVAIVKRRNLKLLIDALPTEDRNDHPD